MKLIQPTYVKSIGIFEMNQNQNNSRCDGEQRKKKSKPLIKYWGLIWHPVSWKTLWKFFFLFFIFHQKHHS